jgi:hypothetical protein
VTPNPVPDRQQDSDHVAQVARHGLLRASGGKAIPRELVVAVAEGRGDPASIGAASRALFGGGASPLELVLFDTDRIASYVFESSGPPVLAGGSSILRGLNAKIADEFHQEVVFSGGGEGLLLVQGGRGAEVCEEVHRRFAAETAGALGVTADFLPVAPEDFLAAPGAEIVPRDGVRLVSGTQAVLARLRDRVRDAKNRRLPERQAVPGGASRCSSCRDRLAGSRRSPRQDLDGEPVGSLCEPCARRWDAGRKLIAGNSFEDLVDNFKRRLGSRAPGARSQYLGFLYADGNSMANLFGRLGSLAELRFASRAVAQVFERTRQSVEAQVGRLLPPEEALLSLLGGGDETIWILPGALAVGAAAQLASWIDGEASRIAGLTGLLAAGGSPRLTFGAGLVLCDLSFPVRYQYELASALLKNAKAMFQRAPRDSVVSSIDFAVLTDSSPLCEDLKTARQLSHRTAEYRFVRTCRPYTCEGFAALIATARGARQASLGKAQLHALQAGAAEGKKVFLNYLRYQVAREPAAKGYRKWIGAADYADPAGVERFFLRRLPALGQAVEGTWIPDMIELKPFLDLLDGAVED